MTYIVSKLPYLVMYCIVLYCIVLYCIVLYCIILYCIVLYCNILYCIVVHCIVCCVLYCVVYSSVLYAVCCVVCGVCGVPDWVLGEGSGRALEEREVEDTEADRLLEEPPERTGKRGGRRRR